MDKVRLILVGGFLGSGKTTLLFETSKRFMKDGLRIGLVTNDQAPELVDTAMLLQTDAEVSELSGSCFCCNFNGFVQSLQQVKANGKADIVIAEPVGSCTDLSATIIQPIKEFLNTELVVSPLTVLADPVKLNDILDGGTAGLHPSAAYIYWKQLEESDIIAINKIDTLTGAELNQLQNKVRKHFPQPRILAMSAKTGIGMDHWFKLVSESNISGRRILEIDYDKYAEGEAVLGWLNGTIQMKGDNIDWEKLAKDFLSQLSKRIDEIGVGVGHVKLMLEEGENYFSGNLTGTHDTINFRGTANRSAEAKMIINARVGIDPDTLNEMINSVLNDINGDSVSSEILAWKSLSPGYPNPTHRYKKVFEK